MSHDPAHVAVLERDLRNIFGPRLQSLVAYGLQHAAPHDATGSRHGTDAHAPRTQALAIVETLTMGDLKRCADRAGHWHDEGLATPLLLAARYGEVEIMRLIE